MWKIKEVRARVSVRSHISIEQGRVFFGSVCYKFLLFSWHAVVYRRFSESSIWDAKTQDRNSKNRSCIFGRPTHCISCVIRTFTRYVTQNLWCLQGAPKNEATVVDCLLPTLEPMCMIFGKLQYRFVMNMLLTFLSFSCTRQKRLLSVLSSWLQSKCSEKLTSQTSLFHYRNLFDASTILQQNAFQMTPRRLQDFPPYILYTLL